MHAVRQKKQRERERELGLRSVMAEVTAASCLELLSEMHF